MGEAVKQIKVNKLVYLQTTSPNYLGTTEEIGRNRDRENSRHITKKKKHKQQQQQNLSRSFSTSYLIKSLYEASWNGLVQFLPAPTRKSTDLKGRRQMVKRQILRGSHSPCLDNKP